MAVFMNENGVLSMGNKTPVTILQETLQRKGITPQYDLIYNGVGTMDPIFKYEVRYRISADSELSAIGSGKSKKEAKHDAAASLLRRMQPSRAVTENESIQGKEQVDIASPYTGALKQNFVGLLEEVCVINKVPNAVFIPISEAGPPHARIFTMMCKVSCCSETAVARTKKQAKHMVAQQMITRLSTILGDKFIPPADKSTEPLEDDNDEYKSMHFKAIESGSYRHDLSIPISEMDNVFYRRMEEFIIPEIFLDLSKKPKKYFVELDKPKQFLDELLNQLEGTCKVVHLSNSLLTEAMEEVDRIVKKVCWGDIDCEEESSENEEENECEEDDYNLVQNEVDSNRPNILEEFDLEIPGDDTCSSSSEHLHSVENSNTFKKEIEDKININTVIQEFEELCLNNSSGNIEKSNSLRIFLSVICPQGQWAFLGTGQTLEDAVNMAAISSLEFFRLMSIPNDPKVRGGSETA